jgi:hypothetical protein
MATMINREIDPSAERSSSLSSQSRLWRVALVIVATGALSHSTTVDAFQINSNQLLARPSTTSTRTTGQATSLQSSAVMEETKAEIGRHERLCSNGLLQVSAPRMFLKSGQVSCQPMSSLSSDFFESTAATNKSPQRIGSNEVFMDVLAPHRNRGVLGFCIQDLGHQVVPSRKLPPSLSSEQSSTSLQSSTDRSQERRQRPALGSQVWKLPETLDEEWLRSEPMMHNAHNHLVNHNPILNRSPKSVEEEDGIVAAPAWFPWMPSITQIEALKVRELKRICADRGLIQVSI